MRIRLSPGVVLGTTALVVAMTGSAVAGSLITSSQIKDGTIQARDVKKGSLTRDRLSKDVQTALTKVGQTGLKGDPGAPGATLQASPPQKGDKGDKGDDASLPTSGNWGVISRNTIGSPNASLRSGPFTPPAGLGTGSLNLSVPGAAEKVAYGNEIDFAGRPVSGLTKVGFYVYNVGENNAGGVLNNMPGITFEIDPNLSSSTKDYASLVWMPNSSVANQWSPYLDATTSGMWGLTGLPGTTCDINGARCTWDQMQAYLGDGGDAASILSVAVTKGRDYAWQGSVDGLTINTKLFDFEEHGVVTR